MTFTVALARKDMEVVAALAASRGVAVPRGRETLARLAAAQAAGFGARDMVAMVSCTREATS